MPAMLLVPVSYLIGSIPFSFMVGRFLGGVDLRKIGSGNVGATNTLRSLGAKAGLLAFFLDMLKGLLVVVLAACFNADLTIRLLCGVLVVVGHCWSIFLKFSGGKGVATSAGVLVCIALIPFFAALTAFLLSVVTTRLVSLGSILAAVVLPFATLLWAPSSEYVWFSIALSVIVLYKHNVNLQRLLQGTEERLGNSKKSS